MSTFKPPADTNPDEVSLPNTQDEQITIDSAPSTPNLAARQKADDETNKHLATPVLRGPIRPLSPSSLSILSAEECEQIYTPTTTAGVNNGGNAISQPARGWRSALQSSWIRNKGLAYMLMAQVFGTLMNVTTRLLEVEGNKGQGMHPFQILFARMGITVVLSSAWMWYKQTEHFPLGAKGVRWLLVARGVGGFFGEYNINVVYIGPDPQIAY